LSFKLWERELADDEATMKAGWTVRVSRPVTVKSHPARLDKRRKYYNDLADNNRTLKQCWEVERELLKDHPNYVAPSHDPSLFESHLIGTLDHLSILAAINKASKPSPSWGKRESANWFLNGFSSGSSSVQAG
jgi:hypothetical protein